MEIDSLLAGLLMPVVLRFLFSDLGIHDILWDLPLNVLRLDLVVLDDFIVLDLASIEGLGLLNIVVLLLDCVEALDVMVSQGIALPSHLGVVLHEPDHRLRAVGVELLVVP